MRKFSRASTKAVVALAAVATLAFGGCGASGPKTAQDVFNRFNEVSKDIKSGHAEVDLDATIELIPDEEMAADMPESFELALPVEVGFEGDFAPEEGMHGTIDIGTDLGLFLQLLGVAPNEGAFDVSGEMYVDVAEDKAMTYVNVDDDNEGWMFEESKLSTESLDAVTGKGASDEFYKHAKLTVEENEHVVTLAMSDLLSDKNVQMQLMEDATEEDAALFESLIETTKGDVVYRFDAKTGYLNKVAIEGLTFEDEGTPETGGLGVAFALDFALDLSDYNGVKAEDVAVPDFVKESAVPSAGADDMLLGEDLDGMLGIGGAAL